MADPLVMLIFENRLNDVLDPDEPLLDVLNTRPASLPDVHVSLEQDYAAVERITIGSPAMFREDGVVLVVVNVRAGIGITDITSLTTKIRDAFHNLYVEHFRVLNVDAPIVPEADSGNFYQNKISVQYQFDFFK